MIKVYIGQNMFGVEPDVIMRTRIYIEDKIRKEGFFPIHICDRGDFDKNLSCETIVKTCLSALDDSDVFLMIDGDEPGQGKIWEMSYAYNKDIPRLVLCVEKDINPWIEYFATEIFDNLDSALIWIKENVKERCYYLRSPRIRKREDE